MGGSVLGLRPLQLCSVYGIMAAVSEEWKQLSSEELMAKKDDIEAEMNTCNTVLENVSCASRDM